MAAFITGNTGSRTTGAHLDFRVWNPREGKYVDPRGFTDRLLVNGQPLTEQFGVTSGYQPGGRTLNGVTRPHDGIDYGTPSGTEVTIDGGRALTTFNDPAGGITQQWEIFDDEGDPFEILLMHGSENNQILSDAAVTDGRSLFNNSPSGALPTATPTAQTVDVMDYDQMSASELNNQYDQLRMAGDALKATNEGMAMHRAYFGKK